MTIDEAIELLNQLSLPGSPDLNPADFDAIKLGSKALNRIMYCRAEKDKLALYPLEGETEVVICFRQ